MLEIGNRNTIRENVTMHPGTSVDNMITKVGDDNLFFVGCHIAHDCVLGNNIIITNDAMLGAMFISATMPISVATVRSSSLSGSASMPWLPV